MDRFFNILLSWLLFGVSLANAQTKVNLRPLDFQNDNRPETHIQGIYQLETNGDHIFIRSEDPYILEIDRNGNYFGSIGKTVFGTQKFQRISAFAVSGTRLAILNTKNSVFLFEDGTFQTYFSSDHFDARFAFSSHHGNGFGFDQDHIVIPAIPKNGYLAVVHAPHGRVLATPGQPKRYPEDLKWPEEGLSTTLWTKDGPFWYALFKFSPTILKFDEAFDLVDEFQITGNAINDCERRLYQPSDEDMDKFGWLPPHFTDFKAFQGNLYVMCLGVLYRIDASSGQTTGEYHFYGRGKSFAMVPKGKRLTLSHFVILNDGTLILSHPALLWDHDLWIADLNLKTGQNTHLSLSSQSMPQR